MSDRTGAEFSLTFPAPPGVEIEASLCTERRTGQGKTEFWMMPDSRRRCLARREPGGIVVKAAFPGPGEYSLWLEAKGPEGEKATTSLRLKADAGLDHGYANFDPRLVELAGEPKLLSPDGASLGPLGSDVVGSRLDLLFPKAEAALVADLYLPHRIEGKSANYEWTKGLSLKKTDAGWLVSALFPKPGDYVIFFGEAGKGDSKGRTFDGLYLSSR
jgi:hypothetical protein